MATEDVSSSVDTDENGGETATTGDVGATGEVEHGDATGTGLESNVAGALAYLFGALSGIVMYVLEPDDEFVRFHASQSIVISGGFFVLAFATTIVTTILSALAFGDGGTGLVFGLVSLVISLAWLLIAFLGFAAWLYLMYQASQGKRTRVPIAAGIADRIA
jgi:uncharacterized membrane protein